MAPRSPKIAPKGDKKAQRRSQDAPKRSQDAARWPQEAPGWPQDYPTWTQDSPKYGRSAGPDGSMDSMSLKNNETIKIAASPRRGATFEHLPGIKMPPKMTLNSFSSPASAGFVAKRTARHLIFENLAKATGYMGGWGGGPPPPPPQGHAPSPLWRDKGRRYPTRSDPHKGGRRIFQSLLTPEKHKLIKIAPK